ncbi:MAG: pyruvate kinase [Erysipelothrix sp.]|nr:pyruvate kinase [Erysipelothrix sp.]
MIDIRKTKIVATIGPATKTYEMMVELAKAGINIARLNFSHETQADHLERMNMIKKVNADLGTSVAILADTKGPEIRCGVMEDEGFLLEKGDIIRVVKEDVLGNKERFTIDVPELYDDVKAGNVLLIDDGKMRLTITEASADELVCRVENPGMIKTRKGVNVPGVRLSMPFISEKDEADIRFACREGADFLAASFVRRKEDILEIREILMDEGKPNMQIIPKIENQEGYDNLREILEVSDGVMVARGDLGVEISLELVPIFQKQMIKLANEMGKPVITATHMLESMMGNPRPTRAEASDVANAIVDGSDAVMLSGETAAGLYPIEAVKTMSTITKAMEGIIPYADRLYKAKKSSQPTIQDSIGIAVADAAHNLDSVDAIVCFTQSGNSAKRLSKFRPEVPILAVTFDEVVQRSLNCYWGVYPIYSAEQNETSTDEKLATRIAKEFGVEDGKLIVIVAGYPSGEGATNMMKIIKVK